MTECASELSRERLTELQAGGWGHKHSWPHLSTCLQDCSKPCRVVVLWGPPLRVEDLDLFLVFEAHDLLFACDCAWAYFGVYEFTGAFAEFGVARTVVDPPWCELSFKQEIAHRFCAFYPDLDLDFRAFGALDLILICCSPSVSVGA